MKSFFNKLKSFCEWILPSRPLADGRWCRQVLLWIAILLCLSAAIVYVVDPCIRYRRPRFYKPFYVDSEIQLPGMIRNYDYNAILLGSSMSQNFRASDFKREMNLDLLKAACPGIGSKDYSLLFDILKEKGGQMPEVLFFNVDLFSYANERESVFPVDRRFFCKRPPNHEYKYYWNYTVWNKYMLRFFKQSLLRKYKNIDYDTMFSRKDRYAGVDEVRRSLKRPKGVFHFKMKKEEVIANLENDVLRHMRSMPATRIEVFFPPYSVLFWGQVEREGKIDEYLAIKNEVQRLLFQLPNVRVHDFQTAESVILNFDNYKDTSHYRENINTWIVKKMASGEYVCTAENYLDNNVALKRIIKDKMQWLKDLDLFPEGY